MLLTFFFLILLPSSYLTDEILRFTVEEKSPVNTVIADLSNIFQIKTSASYFLQEFFPSNQHFFTIDNRTGHLITTENNLDREELCLKQRCSCQSCEMIYHLIIQISERIISKIIQIHIQDRNDHTPIFDYPSERHAIYIKENVPLGYRIVLPIGKDPDEGFNSIQSYRLTGNYSNDFDIDYSSIDIPYLIVRSSLDHQRISSYTLTLIASDNRQQSKLQSGSILIDIRIINQSMPIFLQSVYHIDVREDTPIGTNLLKIEAISDENHEIYYEFLTESPFMIDRLTGNIQLKKLLDYEREKSYRLTVKAYENSIPSYAIIFIHVIDVNDNPVLIHIHTQGNSTMKQMINGENVLFIPEDTTMGTTLGYVILHDFDSIANGNPYLQLTIIEPPLPLMYKLIYQNNFQNRKIYSLILHTSLDRESKSIYKNLQLLAYDSGTPTLQTRLNIQLNITDVNDCIPQIRNNRTIYHIDENNPLGLIIDTLIGYDEDLGRNSELEYLILNKTDLLIVDSRTGRMSLNQSIDFEKFNQEKNLSTIDLNFLIQIQDHGQPSLATITKITLRIHDLNDHAPQFDIDQSYHWIFSKTMIQSGVVLGRIFTYDNDSGLQGIIHYSINSFDSCLILDITSLGYVYVLSQSSCLIDSHRFEIIAKDYGTPNPRVTKQILVINIELNNDENESLPQILPYSTQRTIVDVNSRGRIAFILDITNNQSIQPIVYLNNSDLSTCWNISSTGEFRLIDQPYSSSYILSLNIIDQYTQENVIRRFQIDLCNSSMSYSCQRSIINNDRKENEILLLWAIGLALIITFLCVFVFSMITLFCCRKQQNKTSRLSTNEQTFFQSNEDLHSEKICKTSSVSTVRDDDRDSACVVNTNSSSLSSNILPIQTSRCISSNGQNYQPSTYFYDLKLAELMRNNQHPSCLYVNAQSVNSDYGFDSSEASASLSSYSSMKFNQPNINSSDWTLEMTVDSSPQRQINSNGFICTHECVV